MIGSPEPYLLPRMWRHPVRLDGRDWSIFVATPEGDGPHPPVLVLDAQGTFDGAVSIARTMRALVGAAIDEVAVVGLAPVSPEGLLTDDEQRQRDFTPTEVRDAAFAVDPEKETGRADALLADISELLPRLARRYALATEFTVAGWSLSGLFACHSWLSYPELFPRLLAVSPSLWWDGEVLTVRVAARAAADPTCLRGQSAYLCAGSHEGIDWSASFPPLPPGASWPPGIPDMGAVAEAFAAEARVGGAQVRSEVLPGESHGTIWWAGFTRGLIELHRSDRG